VCGGGEVIKTGILNVFFKLMQPQYFSIVLLLFSIISPTMNKFLCELEKKKVLVEWQAMHAPNPSLLCHWRNGGIFKRL